ncbi:MAG: hypothetical protein Q9201_006541 [Fulgogasparrea decipioides]
MTEYNGPSPADIQWQHEHIHDDRSNEIIVAFGITLGFAITSVLLRFVSRHITRAPLGLDDWIIVLGLICAIGYIVGQSVCIHYGLGRHLIVVTDPISFAKALDASVIFYIASLAATKISILFLYRRIFPKREFHAILWGVGAFILAFTIANILFVAFQCKPISGAWNPFIKAKCINTEGGILSAAVLTIVTDVIILCLPLPSVWKLQLPTIRKFQLICIFLLGTL